MATKADRQADSRDNPSRAPGETASHPAPAVGRGKLTLRVLGTSVTQIPPLKHAAERDLGLTLEFITLDGTEAQRRGALAPHSFDVYDQWFHDLDLIWPTGSIRGIDIGRITRWDQINDLPKTGRLSPSSTSASGGDPSKRLFVQLDGSLGGTPSDRISMVPTVHNADSFAVVGDQAGKINSWGSLLDPKWSGNVILQRDAAIGCLDMLLALKARDELHVGDMGDLTLEEIDAVTEKLAGYCSMGQFRRIWADEAEAIAALRGGIDLIGSLWWSGAVKLRRLGVPVSMVTPVEGFRGWFGGMALSTHLRGRELDAAYDYLNWWLDGYAGAAMARQGSYMSNPEAVRQHLTKAEWDFWYEGKPAGGPITDWDGYTVYDVGESRGGGSYQQRIDKIVVWDAVIEEHNYLVRRWENAISG
ncbi:extracellular solute-binding protein [Nitratireductor sp. XY-223]|uniref:ABC transporter substrate-binding protein n=1 Tax=Nitratireductor sp. XY-223 TaxID=2561926 RepID=UPI00197F76DC|nr:extracellular solute-binding protein [Nitratireductor sp. XY-223]